MGVRTEDHSRADLGPTVTIEVDSVQLQGDVAIPGGARSMVLFAHGSGSSRFSPRNTYVAQVIQKVGIGTFLFDLLTRKEDQVCENRFNIDLLARRLLGASRWVMQNPAAKGLRIGYFGASTGAAAALQAAAELRHDVGAIVSRGGRPDLAMPYLLKVTAPTLLIVGEKDLDVLRLNRIAFEQINAAKDLAIVAGASHLFEEPGALEEVSKLAASWFRNHLS